MSITTLYAELVVVGIGGLLVVFLFFYAVAGEPSWLIHFQPNSLGAAIYAIPVLSIVYLLGIIVVSLSHEVFANREKRLRQKALKNKKYDEIRNDLYTSPNVQAFVHDFEFRRSKVRVCRGWCLNSVMIFLALLTCFLTGRIGPTTTIFWSITAAVLAVCCFRAWDTATNTELEFFDILCRSKSEGKIEAAHSLILTDNCG